MSLHKYKSILFSLLIGCVVVLSGCKTPPTASEPPKPSQKPPPSTEPPLKEDDLSERIDESLTADEDSSNTHTDDGSKIQAQRNMDLPPPAEQGEAGSPPKAIPSASPISKSPAAISSPDSAQTSTELTSDMDRQLQDSLSAFDGKLLKERILLEDLQDAATDGQRSGGAMGDLSTTGEERVVAQDSAEGGNDPPTSAEENRPETTTGTPGKTERGNTRPDNIPPDIPDGRDDDIVARQIREAAMRENDPELKKKLWEEYRKYKQSSGANTP